MYLLFSKVLSQSIVKFFISSHSDVMYQSKFYLDPHQILQDFTTLQGNTSVCKYFNVQVEGRFINLRLYNTLDTNIALLNLYKEGLCDPNNQDTKILIDCLGVNVGKCIHYGHLRSGNIGHILKRLLCATGYQVKIDIHFGDYGKNLGFFVHAHQTQQIDLNKLDTVQLHTLYAASDKTTDNSDYLLSLQKAEEVQIQLKKLAIQELDLVGGVLGYSIDLYNGEFECVLNANKYLTALDHCLETDDQRLKTKTGIYLTRSNGTYLYAFTDICTLYERHNKFNKIIYIVDKRQALHFSEMFKFYNQYINDNSANPSHIPYGMVMDSDREILKSRSNINNAMASMQQIATKYNLDINYMRVALTLNEMRHLVDSDCVLNSEYIEKIFIDVSEFVEMVQILAEAPIVEAQHSRIFMLLLKVYENMYISACTHSIKGLFLPFKMIMDLVTDKKLQHAGVTHLQHHISHIMLILFNFELSI